MVQMIKYRKGYKYQLHEAYSVETGITGFDVNHPLFTMDIQGKLTIRENYAWDGASGPTIDTKNSKAPSLVHDCGFQMMAEGLVSQATRGDWNRLFGRMLRDAGMSAWRAWIWEKAVSARLGGDRYGRKPKKVYTA